MRWPLSAYSAYWRDPSGVLTVEQVARMPAADFTPLSDKLSLGFTKDVVWLRFTLDHGRGTPDKGPLWLELSQNIIQDARLFVPTTDGAYAEALSGPQQAKSARRLKHRLPLFEIPVDRERSTYFLRLASPTSMSTELTLWEPGALTEANTKEGFFWGLAFGAYLLVVVFYFCFWLWTRESVHLVYTAYVAINCLAAVFTGAGPC